MVVPFGETVTVYRETRDRLGNVQVVDERQLTGCAVAPRTSNEVSADGRNTVTTGLTLYAPPGSELTAGHRVRLADDTVWQVQGSVGRWRSPFTNWAAGDQIELDRVTG